MPDSSSAHRLAINPTPDLELSGVGKAFDRTIAVHEASFALRQGEFLSLLDPSGCSKTTTLNMVAGFESPSRGEIRIRGARVDGLPPERRNIGMVFQNYALFPHMTVAENIGFGLRMRRTAKSEAAERTLRAARLVQVDHLLARAPRQLSGGQQQRVALARALVVEPSILLLDEPFSALDRLLREEMQIEIRNLLRRLGITTVFVTHDQDEALSMSDRVAVMFGGRIEQTDTPRTLYAQPATRAVAAFIGKATFVKGVVGPDGAVTSRAGRFMPPPTRAPASPG